MIYSKLNYNMKEIKNNSIQLLVTSPPYYNAINYKKHLKKVYYRGNEKITFKQYLQNMKMSFEESYKKIKQGGFCILVVGDILLKDRIIPLYPYFYLLLTKIGFIFHQNIVWSKMTGGASRFGVTIQHPYPTYYYPNQMTENILVFRKGDKVRIKDSNSKLVIDDLMKKIYIK